MVSFKTHFSSSPRVHCMIGNMFVSFGFHQHVERVATIVGLNAYLRSCLQWALGCILADRLANIIKTVGSARHNRQNMHWLQGLLLSPWPIYWVFVGYCFVVACPSRPSLNKYRPLSVFFFFFQDMVEANTETDIVCYLFIEFFSSPN